MSSQPATRPPLDWRKIEMIEPEMVAIMRAKSVAQSIEITSQAHRSARRLLAMGIRHDHPDWPDADINHEVLKRLINGAS